MILYGFTAIFLLIAQSVSGRDEDHVEYVYRYRVVNWCVTGNNEPALFEWPFVQFKPFLLKTTRFAKYNDTPEIPDPYLGKDPELQEQYKKFKPGPEPPKAKADLTFRRINCNENAYKKIWKAPITTGIPLEQNVGYKNPNEGPAKVAAAATPAKTPFPPWEYFPIDPVGHHKYNLQPATISDMYNDPADATKPYIGSHLHQRIHIEFKLTSTDPKWEGVEGLLIQGNHAPFGMGFPFGQFYRGEDNEGDWPCKCEFNQHRVIPCLSRPDIETVAPTIAIFHQEMLEFRKADPANVEDFPKKLFRVGRKKEFHFNFQWHSHPCSSANLVTFTVLMVHDFYRRRYETRTFGPYDFSPLELSAPNFENLGAGKLTRFESRQDDTRFNNLRWLVPLSNIASTTGTLGRFVDNEYGADTRTGFVQNPFYMPSPVFPHCRRQYLPKPTCTPDPAIVDKCKEEWTMDCHGDTYFPAEIIIPPKPTVTRAPDTLAKTYKLRFNAVFDVDCLTKYPLEQEAYKQCANWTGKFRCDERYEGTKLRGHLFTYKNLIDRNKEMQTSRPGNRADSYFNDTMCRPCKPEVTTTPHPRTTTEPPIFKRSVHGALMIIAFIYLIPMSVIIARYYKETLHMCEGKGFRLWLWLHISISIFAMCLAYASYNLTTFFKLNKHMWLGYAAMFSAGLGLLTGWGRHKIKAVRIMMFWFHSFPSYCSIALAACSMFWSSSKTIQTSFVAQWTIIGAVILVAVVLMVLDCCVYCADKKLGMYPARKHIPILQVRFEDAYSYCHLPRLVFLGIFSVLLLGPVLASFFL